MCRVWVCVRFSHPHRCRRSQVHGATKGKHNAQGYAARVSRDSLTNRRLNLMRRHPFCNWCGCSLVYLKMKPHQTMPDNFATIDHIYSRLMHPDGRPTRGERVLSCPGCNQGRNREEEKLLGAEELTRRAQAVHHYRTSASMMSSSLREFSIP
jgi:hypothetical protein